MQRTAASLVALLATGLTSSPGLAGDTETGGVWQGFYMGADAGYSWGKWSGQQSYTDKALVPLVPYGAFDMSTHDIKANGVITGGHIGRNWQMGGLVWGLELDGAWTNARGSDVLVPYPNDPAHGTAFGTPDWGFSIQQQWQSTLRVRMGYAPGWGALFYGTMGPAIAGFHETHSIHGYGDAWTVATTTSHDDAVKFGWTAGGGMEWAFAPHLTLRTEYLFTSFNNVGGLMTGWDTSIYGKPTDGFKGDFTSHTIRAGLNYSF